MTLFEHYDLAVAQGLIQKDPLQRQILTYFERLNEQLYIYKGFWQSWRRKTTLEGIYLYGPVGVGKTFLMDLFYRNVPIKQKKRFHFHHFMQMVDEQLRQLQGKTDPLKRLAVRIAQSTRVLCLDEFLVHDIADAMILSTLLQELFAQRVVLVATSNTKPDDLYLNGLQRARFIPAIDSLKANCQIISLAEKQDYRLNRETFNLAYLSSLHSETTELLNQLFSKFSSDSLYYRQDAEFMGRTVGFAKNILPEQTLTIQNRTISVVKYSDTVAWFRFDVLCHAPRCQLDYLEIAERFSTIIVSDIPIFHKEDIIPALLFMHFIDVMYDKQRRVIFSAEAGIDNLYEDAPYKIAFQRTLSRLHEMQSIEYWNRKF